MFQKNFKKRKSHMSPKNFNRAKHSTLLAIAFSSLTLFAYGMSTTSSYFSCKSMNVLLDDMKYYTMGDGAERNQGGDLWEHSLWVHYADDNLVTTQSPYSKGIELTERAKMIFSI